MKPRASALDIDLIGGIGAALENLLILLININELMLINALNLNADDTIISNIIGEPQSLTSSEVIRTFTAYDKEFLCQNHAPCL